MTNICRRSRSPTSRTVDGCAANAGTSVNNDSSGMGVTAGGQLTLDDLLCGLILTSGNDAAVAITGAIGGRKTLHSTAQRECGGHGEDRQ